MTTEALKRAKEIEEEKMALKKFADGVENAIVVPGRALPDALRKKASTDGLLANLDALISVWLEQKTSQLDEEFAAL